MGSELVNGPGLGVVRRSREETGAEGGLRGVDAGAMVSPSKPASWSISVASVSASTGLPQREQNLALEETFAPQLEQNMGGRNSITAENYTSNRCKTSSRPRPDCKQYRRVFCGLQGGVGIAASRKSQLETMPDKPTSKVALRVGFQDFTIWNSQSNAMVKNMAATRET